MGMNQMIVLQSERDAQDAPEAAQELAPSPVNAAPTALFEVIDRAVSAVLAQLAPDNDCCSRQPYDIM